MNARQVVVDVLLILGVAVVLYPLLPLTSYYHDAVADGRTNQSLYRLLNSIVAVRQADELVLLDINGDRLDIVGGLADRILRKRAWAGKLTLTQNQDQAIDGANFVVSHSQSCVSSSQWHASQQILQIIIAPPDAAAECEGGVVEEVVDAAAEEDERRVLLLAAEGIFAIKP